MSQLNYFQQKIINIVNGIDVSNDIQN